MTGTVLLLGNYRPAIVVARALAGDGYRVMAGAEGEPLGAHCSRYVDEHWAHPSLAQEEKTFLHALSALLEERPDIEAVLPVSEEFVQFLAAHEECIKPRARLASPAREIIETFSDKQRSLELARAQSVPTLPFALVGDHGALLRAAEKIGFPLTLRGTGTTARLLGRKALIVEDMHALKETLPQWPAGHSELLLQGFAKGQRRNLYFAAQDGRLIGFSQTRIIRTNALDGTGLAVDGVTEQADPRLVADTEKLVAATGYTGIGLTQFIVDEESGGRCFLELNPRVSGSHAVAEHAGLPLSSLAVCLAGNGQGSMRSRISLPGHFTRSGLRYAWTDGDLLAAKYAFLDGDITLPEAIRWGLRAVRTAFAADIQMVWSWRDPGPTLISLLLLLPRCEPLRRGLKSWFARRRGVVSGAAASGVSSIPSQRFGLPFARTASNARSLP